MCGIAEKHLFIFLLYMFTGIRFISFFLVCAVSIQTAFTQTQSQAKLPSLFNKEPAGGQNDEDIIAFLKQKTFVKIFTGKHKVFVGEPLMATYKFYVASDLNDRPVVSKQPEFSGCSVKELNFDQGPEFEQLNGESFSVYTIRKVQLTPLQEGRFSLGKAFVNNMVQVFNPNDIAKVKKFNITVSNNDMEVEVQSLPEKDKPANFYGITGVFGIAARAAENKIPAGENGHLLVTIKGAGNLDAIVQPEINWPKNVQHFEGKDSQHVNQDNFPISGDRIFDIPFIGRNEGNIIIPPIQFSYFNTDLKKYETVQTDSIPVVFTKSLSKKDIYTNIVNYDISNRKYLWIVGAIAITVALLGFISYKRNKKIAAQKKTVMSSTAAPVFTPPQPQVKVKYKTDFERHLNDLQAITENKAFFTKAKSLLTTAVAEKLDSNQYSEKVLMQELVKQTCDAPFCKRAAALYETINLELYAPFDTPADLGYYFTELKQIIEELKT